MDGPRRIKIRYVIIIILGRLIENIKTDTDSSFNETMMAQLWQVDAINTTSITQDEQTAITASDALCDAIYNSNGNEQSLSDDLANALKAL